MTDEVFESCRYMKKLNILGAVQASWDLESNLWFVYVLRFN